MVLVLGRRNRNLDVRFNLEVYLLMLVVFMLQKMPNTVVGVLCCGLTIGFQILAIKISSDDLYYEDIITGGTRVIPVGHIYGCQLLQKDLNRKIDGAGDKKEVEERCEQLRSSNELSTSDYDKEKLQERLAKLSGGVVV
ncbi:chaperonin CPN60-2, mitochondrial [Artemisia annua]|uniref:Chaperonin CPN60-2, mitochondrial n=1 Tax=Artemisia annua TaxID=35608 RepID=A0A2U1PB90_ARTAN|nr:chaperonin CPN60-2, mitochondrial [Artemisia annua]